MESPSKVVYVFYLMCTHSATRRFMIEETSAVAYLIDLLHDKNPQVKGSSIDFSIYLSLHVIVFDPL